MNDASDNIFTLLAAFGHPIAFLPAVRSPNKQSGSTLKPVASKTRSFESLSIWVIHSTFDFQLDVEAFALVNGRLKKLIQLNNKINSIIIQK